MIPHRSIEPDEEDHPDCRGRENGCECDECLLTDELETMVSGTLSPLDKED